MRHADVLGTRKGEVVEVRHAEVLGTRILLSADSFLIPRKCSLRYF